MKNRKFKKRLGKCIYLARMRSNLFQSDIAYLLKVKPSLISMYESGTRSPCLLNFLKLVKLFDSTFLFEVMCILEIKDDSE
ncbi:MAG TPA: helix-turn-helix transcriptional regulator [Candidatus Nanopelagicaceae bacterium]|nr:helix-turn-helix transcriptional regulator [Candidatus Nanopelagicaceae bacterium]